MDNLSFTILVFTYKPVIGLNDRCVAIIRVGRCFFLEGGWNYFFYYLKSMQAIHIDKPYQDPIWCNFSPSYNRTQTKNSSTKEVPWITELHAGRVEKKLSRAYLILCGPMVSASSSCERSSTRMTTSMISARALLGEGPRGAAARVRGGGYGGGEVAARVWGVRRRRHY